jgi:hypothetical protein
MKRIVIKMVISLGISATTNGPAGKEKEACNCKFPFWFEGRLRFECVKLHLSLNYQCPTEVKADLSVRPFSSFWHIKQQQRS